MTYLLDAHCTFVKVVKLFLTVRRLARTLKNKIRKNRDEKQNPGVANVGLKYEEYQHEKVKKGI